MQTAPLPSAIACTPVNGDVAVDTETSGLYVDDGARISIVSVAFRCEEHSELHSWAWPFDQGPVADKDMPKRGRKAAQHGLFDELDVAANLPLREWHALLDWLDRYDHIYHNAKFDLHMLRAGTRQWLGRDFLRKLWWDTKISAWVLDPKESTSLKPTAVRLWGEGEDNEQQALKPYLGPQNDPRFDLVPWEVIGPYAAKDAEMTYRLYDYHRTLLLDPANKQQMSHFMFEMDVCKALTGMERRGIGYDADRAREAMADAQAKLDIVAGRLPFRPTVPEARRYFYETKNAVPHCTTAKSGPSVGECCVRTLIAQEIPGAKEWSQYQKVRHAIDAWFASFIEGLGEDGRLRTDFKQMGTISFRFSSQRKNLQALPHDYRVEASGLDIVTPRSLFVPAPGMQLFEMDLSQAELRYGAKTARCERMMQAIQEGDPHGTTARELFGVTPDDDDWFKYRQVSKRANFALEYSVGPDTFMADLEKQTGIIISRQESTEIVRGWRNLYPEFPEINRRAEMKARRQGFITLVDGRRRYFAPHEELHKAFNQFIQGGIAQVMKRAMVTIDKAHPDILLLQIHDSLVVEVPEDGGAEVAQAASDTLAQIATDMFQTPMTSEVKEWK